MTIRKDQPAPLQPAVPPSVLRTPPPKPAPRNKTAVDLWLQKNNAEAFKDKFYEAGYTEVEDVDSDCIDKYINDKPGVAKRLKNDLAERQKEKAATAMKPPELPPDFTFDLSAPKVTSPDGITFSVPKSLSVTSNNAAIISPNSLTPEEWMIIARGANLLYGFKMDGDVPVYAETPVLDWKVPDTTDFARSAVESGSVTSQLMYTESAASYVSSGFNSQSATAGYLFCSASVQRSYKERTARSSEKKTLIQVGMWKYPRAQIYLRKCTVPSKRFVESVQKALAAPDRYAALLQVFDEFGHVIPTDVTLGGMLTYRESRDSESMATERETETQVKIAVEAKVAKASASAKFGFGSATKSDTTQASLDEFTSFTNHGGDSLLCSNPAEWAPTVKDPRNWAVIAMGRMRPTVDLLEPGLRQQVLDVWELENPEAVGYPADCDWNENEGRVFSLGGGFANVTRYSTNNSSGIVLLVSGKDEDPREGSFGSAAGSAYTHFAPGDSDIHVEYSSIFLPVPKDGQFRSMFHARAGALDARLLFTPNNLNLGGWETLAALQKDPLTYTAQADGFLFVSIDTAGETRGGVQVKSGATILASTYVHRFRNSTIERQSLCVPVPASTAVMIEPCPSSGVPVVRCYWIAMINPRWRMLPFTEVNAETLQTRPNDGLLFGHIWTTVDGDRGSLKVYTGADASTGNPVNLPAAAASAHWYTPHDRWLKAGAIMLPIKAGEPFKADLITTSGTPKVALYWIAIVPATAPKQVAASIR